MMESTLRMRSSAAKKHCSFPSENNKSTLKGWKHKIQQFYIYMFSSFKAVDYNVIFPEQIIVTKKRNRQNVSKGYKNISVTSNIYFNNSSITTFLWIISMLSFFLCCVLFCAVNVWLLSRLKIAPLMKTQIHFRTKTMWTLLAMLLLQWEVGCSNC